jgi:hypothetical protein
MEIKFIPNPDETILYHFKPSRKWYALAWRIGLEAFEVAVFIFFSYTAFTNLTGSLLATFLPENAAIIISRVIFQAIAPLLVIAWFTEDTARIFSSELILTDQRIWTKGSPYAWSQAQETPLSDVKSMASRRDALFIHLRSIRKVQVFVLPDGKQIVNIFKQCTGKAESN